MFSLLPPTLDVEEVLVRDGANPPLPKRGLGFTSPSETRSEGDGIPLGRGIALRSRAQGGGVGGGIADRSRQRALAHAHASSHCALLRLDMQAPKLWVKLQRTRMQRLTAIYVKWLAGGFNAVFQSAQLTPLAACGPSELSGLVANRMRIQVTKRHQRDVAFLVGRG